MSDPQDDTLRLCFVDTGDFDQVPQAGFIACVGPDAGSCFTLAAEATTIGRDGRCDITLSDRICSREHLEIRDNKGVFVAVDLETTNGTFVNEERIVRCKLEDGDTIRIGGTLLRFIIDDDLLRRFEGELARLSGKDVASPVFTELHFFEQLEREFARAIRFDRPVSLTLFEVEWTPSDLPPSIEESLRHLLFQRIKAQVRGIDVVGHCSTKWIALIAVETGSLGAGILADRIVANLAKRQIELHETVVQVSLSAGVVGLTEYLNSVARSPQEARRRPFQANRLMHLAKLKLRRARLKGADRAEKDHLLSYQTWIELIDGFQTLVDFTDAIIIARNDEGAFIPFAATDSALLDCPWGDVKAIAGAKIGHVSVLSKNPELARCLATTGKGFGSVLWMPVGVDRFPATVVFLHSNPKHFYEPDITQAKKFTQQSQVLLDDAFKHEQSLQADRFRREVQRAHVKSDLLEEATGAMGIGMALWAEGKLIDPSPTLCVMTKPWKSVDAWFESVSTQLPTSDELTSTTIEVTTMDPSNLETVFRLTVVGKRDSLEEGAVTRVILVEPVSQKKRERQDLEELASLTVNNPNPMLRVSSEGVIEFANVPSTPILSNWGVKQGQRLRGKIAEMIKDASKHDKRSVVHITVKDAKYCLDLVPIQGEDVVACYGRRLS